jgi:hypothetical protein
MTCIIDTFKARDITTLDIRGTFMQTDLPADKEPVNVILEERMTKLLVGVL